MKKKIETINDDFEIDNLFDEEIEGFLESYRVQLVEEERIERTIECLKEYLPRKKEKYELLKLIKNQITYINSFYWIVSFLIFILGMIFIGKNNISAYEGMLYIAPIPILLGIYELEKGKREGVWELEKSFKYSYSKITLVNLLIVISFTTIINIFLSFIIANTRESVILINLMAMWIAPMAIIFLINAIVLTKIKTDYPIVVLSITWVFTLLITHKVIIKNLINGNFVTNLVTIIISMVVIALIILDGYKKSKDYEGELLWS